MSHLMSAQAIPIVSGTIFQYAVFDKIPIVKGITSIDGWPNYNTTIVDKVVIGIPIHDLYDFSISWREGYRIY